MLLAVLLLLATVIVDNKIVDAAGLFEVSVAKPSIRVGESSNLIVNLDGVSKVDEATIISTNPNINITNGVITGLAEGTEIIQVSYYDSAADEFYGGNVTITITADIDYDVPHKISEIFPDPALAQEMASWLGLSVNDEINRQDVINHISADIMHNNLELYNSAIVDLTGLQIFDIAESHHLVNLRLRTNASNYDAVGYITSLKMLSIDTDTKQVVSNDFFGSLTNIIDLQLNNVDLQNVNMSNLTMLRNLFLDNVSNADMTQLTGINTLQQLDIVRSGLKNTEEIGNINSLKELRLDYQGLTDADMTFLNTLTNLQTLSLNHNKLHDINFLTTLNNLKNVELGYNLITDINALNYVVNLETALVENNMINMHTNASNQAVMSAYSIPISKQYRLLPDLRDDISMGNNSTYNDVVRVYSTTDGINYIADDSGVLKSSGTYSTRDNVYMFDILDVGIDRPDIVAVTKDMMSGTIKLQSNTINYNTNDYVVYLQGIAGDYATYTRNVVVAGHTMTLKGKVAGNVVKGVDNIELEIVETGQKTVTDNDGNYDFGVIPYIQTLNLKVNDSKYQVVNRATIEYRSTFKPAWEPIFNSDISTPRYLNRNNVVNKTIDVPTTRNTPFGGKYYYSDVRVNIDLASKGIVTINYVDRADNTVLYSANTNILYYYTVPLMRDMYEYDWNPPSYTTDENGNFVTVYETYYPDDTDAFVKNVYLTDENPTQTIVFYYKKKTIPGPVIPPVDPPPVPGPGPVDPPPTPNPTPEPVDPPPTPTPELEPVKPTKPKPEETPEVNVEPEVVEPEVVEPEKVEPIPTPEPEPIEPKPEVVEPEKVEPIVTPRPTKPTKIIEKVETKVSIKPTENIENTGVVHGYVTDGDNKGIEGALIELHSKPRTTYTDADGYYRFDNVEAGEHNLYVKNPYTLEILRKITVQAKANGEDTIVDLNPTETIDWGIDIRDGETVEVNVILDKTMFEEPVQVTKDEQKEIPKNNITLKIAAILWFLVLPYLLNRYNLKIYDKQGRLLAVKRLKKAKKVKNYIDKTDEIFKDVLVLDISSYEDAAYMYLRRVDKLTGLVYVKTIDGYYLLDVANADGNWIKL